MKTHTKFICLISGCCLTAIALLKILTLKLEYDLDVALYKHRCVIGQLEMAVENGTEFGEGFITARRYHCEAEAKENVEFFK